MSKPKTKEPLPLAMAKLILTVGIIVGVGAIMGVLGYFVTKPKLVLAPEKNELKETVGKIEISSDGKSIQDAKTKEAVLWIDATKKYLKDSGYEYNADTFQTTDAKYMGECFLDAALSNKGDKIVFSSGCLPGDLPQAWIGVYKIFKCPKEMSCDTVASEQVNFLVGGSGRDFVWSEDDKTIIYVADLGLSGLTEKRVIDSETGEILERKNAVVDNSKIVDKISQLEEQSTKKLIELTMKSTGLTEGYAIDNKVDDYDTVAEGFREVSILKEGKIAGTFKEHPDLYYIPVHVNKNEIFMVASCGGIGGICRGELAKFNFATKKKLSVATGTMDFFLSKDKKYLVYFILDDNWQDNNLFVFNLENDKVLDQSVKLTCEIGTNITKGCRDLFLENNGEIIYLPLDYKGVEMGVSYKLSKTVGSRAEKFSADDFRKIMSMYNLIEDETANWKTYKNEKYGFEVKYPEDFKEQKASSDLSLLETIKTNDNGLYYFKISVTKNYKIDQIISSMENVKEITVGGQVGYGYFYTEGAGMSAIVMIQMGQNALNISFDDIGNGRNFATANDRKAYIQDFLDQILSTFKFTEPQN